jgi:hypothetical protein
LVDTKTSKYNAWNENIKFDNAWHAEPIYSFKNIAKTRNKTSA